MQKQPPEVFYEKRCCWKFHKIHRKTSVPESQACNLIKKEETLASVFSCEFCEISKTIFFTEHLWTTVSDFVTEMLIFRSSRSQMFFKIVVLKNFAILKPLSNNKVVGLLLQNTYGCFWIFAAANTFLRLNLVFIADSRTGFCAELLWKHELNLRSSYWSCSVKKVLLENLQISQENNCVEVSF